MKNESAWEKLTEKIKKQHKMTEKDYEGLKKASNIKGAPVYSSSAAKFLYKKLSKNDFVTLKATDFEKAEKIATNDLKKEEIEREQNKRLVFRPRKQSIAEMKSELEAYPYRQVVLSIPANVLERNPRIVQMMVQKLGIAGRNIIVEVEPSIPEKEPRPRPEPKNDNLDLFSAMLTWKLLGVGSVMFAGMSANNMRKSMDQLSSRCDMINSSTINGRPLSNMEKFMLAYALVSKINNAPVREEDCSIDSALKALEGFKGAPQIGTAELLSKMCTQLGISNSISNIERDFNGLTENFGVVNYDMKDNIYGINGHYSAIPAIETQEEKGPTILAAATPDDAITTSISEDTMAKIQTNVNMLLDPTLSQGQARDMALNQIDNPELDYQEVMEKTKKKPY